VHEFLQNSVFSPRSARFVISALGAPILSDFQRSARVWRRSARFATLPPGTPLLSHFQQSARVCGKQRFQPETRTFRHFLAIFSKMHEFVQNSVSSARSARLIIFLPGTKLFGGFEQSGQVCKKQSF